MYCRLGCRHMGLVSLYAPRLLLLCGRHCAGRRGTYPNLPLADHHPVTRHPFTLQPGDLHPHTLIPVSPRCTLTCPWRIPLVSPIPIPVPVPVPVPALAVRVLVVVTLLASTTSFSFLFFLRNFLARLRVRHTAAFWHTKKFLIPSERHSCFPLGGLSTRGKGLLAVLHPPYPLVAKSDMHIFPRLVLTPPPPPPPLPWASA